jgi:hypothetical protein
VWVSFLTPPSQHHANATKDDDSQDAFDQGANDFLFHRFLSFNGAEAPWV